MSATVLVLGGSLAGLATALRLARDGHRVTVVERDGFDVGPSQESIGWERRGVPHFLQPHAIGPRGRAELRDSLPDVFADLLAAGAGDVDVAARAPGGPRPGDDDLRYLAVRRPVIEWALRRAVDAEPRIDVRATTEVTGLVLDGGRVTGVRTDGGDLDGDLVVDALGRRAPTTAWLRDAGVESDPAESSDCGVVYYNRYYRVRPGFELPDGPWLLSPRGDLGYLGFATFPGDNDTFAALLAVPSGVPEWRAFGDAAAFEAAADRIPMLRLWVDPEKVEPITDMMPMAGLRNTLRHYGPTTAVGLVPVGDALCHTDPVLAHGVAFAFVHATALAAALRDHSDVVDASSAYAAAVMPALRERYDLATALDEQRRRMWLGEPVDFAHHDGDYALFSLVAGGAVAMADAEVFRMYVRRIGLLDSTAVLDDDVELQRRIEETFAAMRATPRPAPGPSRDEMLALVGAG
ncbi:MAG TPA: NAD(P)-binding protein [Acidimicrobiales bacterium]|nr:NAD(P)-binding protein [Acidimicrobiales bacterium]